MLTNQNKQLWRYLLGFFFQTVPGAMLAPMLTLGLAAREVDATLIGALATVGSVAYILSLPAAPALIGRIGAVATQRVGLVLGALSVLGLALSDWPALWVVLYAAMGFAAGLRYTIAESWVPALAGLDARGRAVALFQTIVGASSFIGAGALLLTGTEGLLPRAIAVVATLVGVVVLWPVEAPAQPAGEASFALNWSSLRGLVGQVGPAVLGAALIGGLFESGLSVALPLFGLAIGVGPALAAGLVTALGLGSLAQYPFGALADRFPWRSVALGTAGMIALSALLLPFATGWPWLLLVLGVVWGSAGGGLYTLAVISNSNRWRGKQLVGVSVVTQFAYMIGEAGGPALGGLSIDLSPQYGLPILVAGAALSGLALLLGAARGRAEAPRGSVPAADAVQA
jgi:MFS family permease